jgi:HEPN domain-containing protein
LYLFQKPYRKPIEIICYHCQQSVEKSLKAFLCANEIKIPKTHDTGYLCRKYAEIDNAFLEYLKPCEELAIYATETRYPIRIEIDEVTVKCNLQQAWTVYNFITGIIKEFEQKKNNTDKS